MKITSHFRPEHGERRADVWFEVCHEEAVPEVIGEAVLIQVVVDQSKEGAVGLSFLVRHHSYDTGDVDAAQKSHQDESLENQGFNIAQNYTFHGQKCCLGTFICLQNIIQKRFNKTKWEISSGSYKL